MRHRLPSQARHRGKQHASPDASSVQPDPSHTVGHGRYLPFEWPAARALSARALTYAVRRGGPTTFTEPRAKPAHAIVAQASRADRSLSQIAQTSSEASRGVKA